MRIRIKILGWKYKNNFIEFSAVMCDTVKVGKHCQYDSSYKMGTQIICTLFYSYFFFIGYVLVENVKFRTVVTFQA